MARASARRCKSRDGLSFSCWPNSDRIIVCPLPQRRNFLEVLIAFAAVAAVPFTPLFGKWTRLSLDPILSPRGEGFESAGTFNPSVVKQDGKYVMLYRAQDHSGTSSLGYATSDDGIHFNRRPEPVMVSEAPYEKGGGVEDPRLQKIGNTYYLTYTGYN